MKSMYAATSPAASVNAAPHVSIDDVIKELEHIIQSSVETNTRLGYFAALYLKVTVRVKEGIANGEFENASRMEKFDVLFASRYLDAVKQWHASGKPSAPWEVAFDTTRRFFPLILQHLLLGMN